jgi:hypothetical protein
MDNQQEKRPEEKLGTMNVLEYVFIGFLIMIIGILAVAAA